MKRFYFVTAAILALVSCRMVNISNDLLEIRTAEHMIDQGDTISFNNTNGDLKLLEWENPYVMVETRIYGDSAVGIPEGLDIICTESGSGLEYFVDYPGGLSFVSVDFDVRVPEGSGHFLAVQTVNGDLEVDADVILNVESVNGDMKIKASGSTGITTVNGDVEASLSHQAHSFTVEAVNGDMKILLPEGIGIEVETCNGDIVIDGQGYDDEVRIQGMLELFATVETVNGDIEVTRNL